MQADEGQQQCESCTESRGARYTSDDSRTSCVLNEALLSGSFIEYMLDSGAALGVSFVFAACFFMIAAYIAYVREKLPERLANFSRLSTLCSSLMSGFSAGAEFVLIMAFFTVEPRRPGLGVVMLLGRLIHVVGGAVLGMALFGYGERMEERAGWLFAGMSSLSDTMDQEYLEENVYMVEMTMLCALCDTTMLQFMPYKKSRFYVISEGWPSMNMMKLCLAMRMVQTVVSVACELAYLSEEDDGGMNESESALLYMNIILGVLGAAYALLMLFMRRGILRNTEDAPVEDAAAVRNRGKEDVDTEGGEARQVPVAGKRKSAEFEMLDLYGLAEPDEVPAPSGKKRYTLNPLYNSEAAGMASSADGADGADGGTGVIQVLLNPMDPIGSGRSLRPSEISELSHEVTAEITEDGASDDAVDIEARETHGITPSEAASGTAETLATSESAADEAAL